MRFLDFAKQKPKLVVLGLVVAATLAAGFTFTRVFVFTSYGGTLSPYLIGYFDVRTDDNCPGNACADSIMANRTDVAIDLLNPTTTSLRAFIALFSSSGFLLTCTTRNVDTNENERIFLRNDIDSNIFDRTGVIKVVTALKSDNSRIQAGVKGAITHYVTQQTGEDCCGTGQVVVARQANMEEVPVEVLKKDRNVELDAIVNPCF